MSRGTVLRTLGLALAALAAYLLPGAAERLVYDRQAILAGEIWRLLTGHLVHFSAAHLWANLAAVGVAGLMIARRGYAGLPLLWVVSALCISLGLLLLKPQMAFYGGLSGVATAGVGFFCGRGLSEKGRLRHVCAAALLVLGGKIFWEVFSGHGLLSLAGVQPFVPLPLAHAIGGLVGVCWARLAPVFQSA